MSSPMSWGLSPPTPNLQYLPAELVDEIAQYLLSMSKLSLRYTCHRFRHHFSVTIESIWEQHSTKPSSNAEERQWYNFLCMLERDQRISQLVCGACKQTHHISMFSQNDQQRYPRRCLASEGKPWVCPHASYTRAEIGFLRIRVHAAAYKHACRPRKLPLLVEGVRFLKHYCLWAKDYCLWLASHPGIHTQFAAHHNCSCRKIKAYQHMLLFHIEASTFTLLQTRVGKALGMSAVVKCAHLYNPTEVFLGHENIWRSHERDLSFRCRLCMEHGVVNDVSKQGNGA